MGKRTQITTPILIRPGSVEQMTLHKRRRLLESTDSVAMALLSIKQVESLKAMPVVSDFYRRMIDDPFAYPDKIPSFSSSVTDDEDDSSSRDSLTPKRSVADTNCLPPIFRALLRPPTLPKPRKVVPARTVLPAGRPLPPAPGLPSFLMTAKTQPLLQKL